MTTHALPNINRSNIQPAMPDALVKTRKLSTRNWADLKCHRAELRSVQMLVKKKDSDILAPCLSVAPLLRIPYLNCSLKSAPVVAANSKKFQESTQNTDSALIIFEIFRGMTPFPPTICS